MKVLQINSVCGYGSTGRIATDIYKVLEDQGHECLIAYGREAAPEKVDTIRIGTFFDNYMHVAKTRLFDLHGFASTRATYKFIEQVKEYNPDVIHLHNLHGYYINIELLFSFLKEAKKPVVWTLHDCWAFTGHCAYFDYVKCEKWKEHCDKCPQKRKYPASILIDNSKFNYERKRELFTGIENMTIVTPSKWLADLVKLSFLKEYEVNIINNGIDLRIFSPKGDNVFSEKYMIQDAFIILGVASIWDERKGFNCFLELAKRIDSNSKIVLVGLTDKQITQLPQNIIGITRTNNIEELSEIYSSADVFVNPTFEETLGLVNLEALACGTPVITFDTGGSVECVDEKCAIVVEKGNIEGLVKAINSIKVSNITIQNCVQKAREFDKNAKYKQYVELYEQEK